MNTPGDLPLKRELVDVARRGLAAAWKAGQGEMPFTMRGLPSADGPVLRAEGRSVRYTAIAALGLSRLPDADQREVLGGSTAHDLARACLQSAGREVDPGAWAVALWAAGEVAQVGDDDLARRLVDALRSPSIATVDCAWAVIAGHALPGALSESLVAAGLDRLRAHQGPGGLFPHVLPPQGRLRGHVGSFADQIYPIQALSRHAVATADHDAIRRANRGASTLVKLQGSSGQWWWHYDARSDQIVERFPVYSVHQHGMAPMVLDELAAAGGDDHGEAVSRGLWWVQRHPESVAPMISRDLGVVWRKIGRREVRKAGRGLAALTTALRPGSSVPFIDRVLPPGSIDRECRPYELGWLLYAQCSAVSKEDQR